MNNKPMNSIVFDSLKLGSTFTNDHYHRGYEGTVTSPDNLQVLQSGDMSNNTSVDVMAALAPMVLQLAPPKATISIPNGWGTERFGFVLTLTATKNTAVRVCTTRYVITGWTDMLQMGLSNTQIDPTTIFNISNVTSEELAAEGVNGASWECLASYGRYDDLNVINNSPTMAFKAKADTVGSVNNGSTPAHLANVIIPSEKSPTQLRNRTPMGYISEMVNGVSKVRQDSVVDHFGGYDFGGEPSAAYTTAVANPSADIIAELNRLSNFMITNYSFPVSMLYALDPGLLSSRTDYVLDYQTTPSEYLDNSGLPCQMATSMFDHVTSIAAGVGLVQVDFFTTNMITAQQQMEIGNFEPHQLRTIVGSSICTNPNAIAGHVEQLFTYSLSAQGGPFLTRNGDIRFEMNVSYEMFSECKIQIRLEGEREPTLFSFGAFASNVNSPLMTVAPSSADHSNPLAPSTDSLVGLITPIKTALENRLVTTASLNTNQQIRR